MKGLFGPVCIGILIGMWIAAEIELRQVKNHAVKMGHAEYGEWGGFRWK